MQIKQTEVSSVRQYQIWKGTLALCCVVTLVWLTSPTIPEARYYIRTPLANSTFYGTASLIHSKVRGAFRDAYRYAQNPKLNSIESNSTERGASIKDYEAVVKNLGDEVSKVINGTISQGKKSKLLDNNKRDSSDSIQDYEAIVKSLDNKVKAVLGQTPETTPGSIDLNSTDRFLVKESTVKVPVLENGVPFNSSSHKKAVPSSHLQNASGTDIMLSVTENDSFEENILKKGHSTDGLELTLQNATRRHNGTPVTNQKMAFNVSGGSIERVLERATRLSSTATPFYKRFLTVKENLGETLKVLQPFMEQIDSIRTEFLKPAYYKPKVYDSYHTADPKVDEDYFDKVEKYKSIKTVKISVNWNQLKPLLTKQIYDVTTSRAFQSKNDSERYKLLFTYNPDRSNAFHNPYESKPEHFALGMPPDSSYNGSHIMLSYMHIIPGGTVLNNGEAYCDDLYIMTGTCKSNPGVKPAKDNNYTHYQEVFSMAATWGEGFFHATAEDISRMIPYVEFLKAHPEIKIHVKSVKPFVINMLDVYGLNANRLINGKVIASVLYIPAGQRCGAISTFSAQLISMYLRSSLSQEVPDAQRQSVVLIKRSSRRYFKKHDAILSAISDKASSHGLTVRVFDDKRLPSFRDTIKLFNSAKIVVAPHGAGLSNMLMCQSGTVIIEGLCGNGNLCYTRFAYALGHIYYGVYARKDCLLTEPDEIKEPFSYYIGRLHSRGEIS